MPPKKDEKKKEETEVDGQAELIALQGAKQDLELGQSILVDNIKQCKAENEQLLQQIEKLKSRITNSTQDYVDILQHREEQIKAADGRANTLQLQLERMQTELAQSIKEIAALKEANANATSRLDDAQQLLADKDRLEETVKKQHALIEQRGQEIKVAKAQMESKEAALEKAREQNDDLRLRCQANTQLHVLFNEPWLVQISHVKLKGAIPYDREFNTLSCTAGGKQLVLSGGHSRSHESVGRQTAVLSLDSLTWEQPGSAMQQADVLGHTAAVVGRNKLLVFGGSHGEEATSAVQLLAIDTMKWSNISPNSSNVPSPRLCHAAAALTDKVYIFGGMTIDGHLLNDLWALDLDSMQWHQPRTFGVAPSARKGASLCASEDGRRLYLFGGHDGFGTLNDCSYFEVEQLLWSPIQPTGKPPEPRESHVAAMLGKFMVITGGCGSAIAAAATAGGGSSSSGDGTVGASSTAAAGTSATAGASNETSGAAAGATPAAAAGSGGGPGKRLNDTFVLDLYSGPCWEQLSDGGTANPIWSKLMSVNSVMHGNKLFKLQPNLHEQLDELQIMTLTLPEDIERMKTAKRRDQEQVDVLELLDHAVTTSSSMEVSWRPPTKNKDRITGYKLMLSTSTGVVRDAYKGKATSFTCTGLKPGGEYVLSVKVTYDDGSFLWSDSKAYHTRMA